MKTIAARGERGMTLVELIVGLAVSFIVIGAALSFVISQVTLNAASFNKTDLQREGRVAIAKIAQRIELAGLGLPPLLAFQEFRAAGSQCSVTPDLVVVSLDYTREWHVANNGTAGGTTSGGTVNLQSASPSPSTAEGFSPAASDIALPFSAAPGGTWLFLYQSNVFNTVAPLTGNHGYGMVHITARALGATSFTVDSTAFQNSYPGPVQLAALNLGQSLLGQTDPRPTAVLVANVTRIGVDCGVTSPVHKPYLYFQDQNGTTLLASNIDTTGCVASTCPQLNAAANDVVGLRFRFLLDLNHDGVPDDQNGDGIIDANDYVSTTSATFTTQLNGSPWNIFTAVMGVEVVIRVLSDQPDTREGPNKGKYQTMDFVERVTTPNIQTSSNAKYIFVDNLGL